MFVLNAAIGRPLRNLWVWLHHVVPSICAVAGGATGTLRVDRMSLWLEQVAAELMDWCSPQQLKEIYHNRLEFTSKIVHREDDYRQAVEFIDPDYVIITDAWNMKPILAEAVRGYPYLLRFQAQECLCPLNNLRLLASGPETFEQCPGNQLTTPDLCRRCLGERGLQSGSLHQWERGWPESERRNMTKSFGGLWKRPRPCWS